MADVEYNEEKNNKKTKSVRAKKLGIPSSGIILADQMLPYPLFVLPVKSAVVYPTMMAPVMVSVPRFVNTVEVALEKNKMIGLILTKEELSDGVSIQQEDLYHYGVVVKILKRLKMPDGSVSLLIQSMKRFRVNKFLTIKPHIVVDPEYLEESAEKSNEIDAYSRIVISQVKKLSESNPFFTEEMKLAMINAPGPGAVADIVAFALALPNAEAQKILETLSVKERFELLLMHLKREQNVADLQRKIQGSVNSKISSMQREYFLKEQLKTIKKELGIEEDGKSKMLRIFKEKIDQAHMPKEAEKVAREELSKFETISEQSPEYNVSRNYLEVLTDLPWSTETKDNLDLKRARKILNTDHYGLESIKERIVEFLAVKKLKNSKKGSIICLVGPPGVGKTSIGKSIARTLDRNFYRFSLGGMRDEAEIKGHRRTYIGAMPGKIISAIKRAGSKNAVLMLDEIDKLSSSFQGDPASALLEVLDPEQNSKFIDHYLDVPFDLSKVLFVATANTTSTIPSALLDRMEVIEIPGYTLEEKEKIASRYVIPKILKENGLKSSMINIPKETLKVLLKDYAREPGLRSLQKQIEKISRKAAIKIVENPRIKKPIQVLSKNITQWVGPKRFYNEVAERIEIPGIVVGLAWTSMGGDILFIESTELPGTGQLKLTGQMGSVMTESAQIAWSFVKKRLGSELKFTQDDFKNNDIHLHIPAGAIPKDGPSAGVTMATSLYSLMTKRVFKQKLAMTGELSLTGKVLPVGGIKEKLLAAKRSGINAVILPKLNQKDFSEIPDYVLKGMKIHFVDHIDEVFDLALAKKKKS